ncbi:putative myo-inositol phosphate synthase [Actinoplanes missouriensis 431]|uniref:Putative myo-inositol phosphate synthase n=1 Tax=Actinoplanes missouriensis (strain ATCC 14538 / DSM 43046 / CBS 188.64 / JCM 3121 / NBRC 102363 / NCIMB 12654 / NRRL B-3342 / UNCC 431) TaxID=512565 RepID=I0H9T4_ACTM4|nr:inositol-3-phosphate synthase [Actinoplanes missouriensis]BAL89771.1 putative myo-inositol phosphate synthase [Actinoplanes missouriensis 431]
MGIGVWLMGARGSVAVTSVVGALAVRAGLAEPSGMVTESPPLRDAALPGLTDLVFGGHDITAVPVVKKAESLAAAGVLPAGLVASLGVDLGAVEREARALPVAATQRETAELIAADITGFRDRHGLDRVVVINVASTEAAASDHPAHADPAALEAALGSTEPVLPASALAAYAAFRAGCPFIDFTPSTGARLPALEQLAAERGLPYGGRDGKTGETLVKSVLAPMFMMRNLRVRSWSGTNLLGGGDGANLADPAANAAKAGSKQRVLKETLGYQPQGHSLIEYVDDIGDFKTAWDLITFTGFLGVGMRMEFSWHGCDSALAAPLVLDLARLVAAAHAAGRSGPLTELAFFFKDPLGDVPHGLADQWANLINFAHSLSDQGSPSALGALSDQGRPSALGALSDPGSPSAPEALSDPGSPNDPGGRAPGMPKEDDA